MSRPSRLPLFIPGSPPPAGSSSPSCGSFPTAASKESSRNQTTTSKPEGIPLIVRSSLSKASAVILSERGPKVSQFRGPCRQVFVCGVEVGGGESKDLLLHLELMLRTLRTGY